MLNNPENSLLHIYSASAGSGKTFTLTREFLKLALQNPLEKPFKILAITFTNKATTEMRTRIIKALIELAKNKKSPHVDFLTSHLKIDESELRLRAQIALTEILHNYHRLGISTIDKFFQKILRSFAREIKRVGFETEIIQDDAIDFMIQGLMDELSENDNLKNWILSFARERIQEKSSNWNFKNELENHANQLFSEKFKELNLQHKNQNSADDLTYYVEIKKQLQAISLNLEAQFESVIEHAKKQFVHFDPDNIPGKSRNIITSKLLGNKEISIELRAFNDIQQAKNTYVEKYGHNFKGDNEINIQTFQTEFIDKGIAFCQENAVLYQTIQVILSNLYTLAISFDLIKQLDAYRNENNILLLSDSNEFISIMTKDTDTPFIYEKIGSRYEHYLLDEFQDTSTLQWENLKPLLQNSLDQGFENLIVGDAKQAIYRFRNGDKSLLQYKVQDEFYTYSQTHNLDTNYRSLQNVILFNNSIAHIAAKVVKENALDNKDLSEWAIAELERSVELFRSSAQKHTNASGGYVELDFQIIENKEDDDSNEETTQGDHIIFNQAYNYIQDAIKRGYKQSDICVLARKNKALQDFSHFVSQKNSTNSDITIQTVSSETGLLTVSAAVRCIISCMQFVNNPKDTIRLIEVISAWNELKNESFQAHILQERNSTEILLGLLPNDFMLNEIQHKSLLDAYHYIIHGLQLNIYKEHAPYLQGLEDKIIQFVQKYKTGISGFLHVWNLNSNKYMLSTSEDMEGVKLMTIHKSKGLQFPIVIYISQDTTVKSNHNNKIWVANEEGISSKLGILNIPVSKSLTETEFKSAYEVELIENINDGLNAFYVAITRPERELYIVSKIKLAAKGGVSKINSVDQFIYESLFLNNQNHYPESELFLNPSSHISENKIIVGIKENYQANEDSKKESELVNVDFYTCNPHRNIKIKPARILTEKREIRLGMLTHELLALVKNQNDISKILQEWFMNGDITEGEMDDMQNLLGQLFGNLLVSSWFNTEAEVLTETPLITQNGSIRIPDRILLHKDYNEIIDFKTGKAMQEHENQITEYAHLISELTQKPSKAYLLYLNDLSIKEVLNGK